VANPSWPTDPASSLPNAFDGAAGGPLLNHQHLYFDVLDPSDLAPNGDLLPGATLALSGIDPALPVGYVVVYLYDPNNPKWPRIGGPRVLALVPYPGPAGAALSVQITEGAPRGNLHPIAIESLAAWRAWLAAWQSLGGGGGTGNAGDGNTRT
jgi:hypothetical protein